MSGDAGSADEHPHCLRSDRRRQWRNVPAIALIIIGLAVRPGAAQCVGDCNGDGTVLINEIIQCVNIALGTADLSDCSACSSNGQTVVISDLITAVNNTLNGCPGPPVTVTGSCAAPGTGNHGLKPCDPGTPITVLRCDDRTQCLHRQGLTMLGATTVASGGTWSVQVPITDASTALVFQASITNAVVYRALSFGTVGGAQRAGLVRDVSFAPADITPVTEAGVDLLDSHGFQNYADSGAQEVLAAVEQATANLSFDGLAADVAAALAVKTANADPTVMAVLQTASDTVCPSLTIDSPTDGGTVNAGSSIQVLAHATDDGANDTGVKRFRYSATGDALVSPVSQDSPFSMPLPTASLQFTFTVKSAMDLLGVADRTITISVEAIDDAGNTCGAQTISVGVVGLLDQCDGTISAQPASGYDDVPFVITVVISGSAKSQVTRVTSDNPGGEFDLDPQGNGVFTVTLYYQGEGQFTLTFTAFDAHGDALCSGSIDLEALGPAPSSDSLPAARRMPGVGSNRLGGWGRP